MDHFQHAMVIRSNAIMVKVESMKVDNQRCAAMGGGPMWSSDHFDGYAHDLESLAETLLESQ